MPEPTDPQPNVDASAGAVGRAHHAGLLRDAASHDRVPRSADSARADRARRSSRPTSARIDVDQALVAPLAGVQVVRLASLTPTGPARAARQSVRRERPVVAFGEEHCFPEPSMGAGADRRPSRRGTRPSVRRCITRIPRPIVSWADLLIGYGPWLAPVPRRGRRLPARATTAATSAPCCVEYGDELARLMEAETVLMWDLRGKGHRLLLDPAAQTAHMNFGLWSSWVPRHVPQRPRVRGHAIADVAARDAARVRRPPRRSFRSLGSRARSVTRDASARRARFSPA